LRGISKAAKQESSHLISYITSNSLLISQHPTPNTQRPTLNQPHKQTNNRDKDFGYQKSSIKNGDLNPVWNEDFQFSNVPDLDNMVLTLKVMDSDIGSKDDKCGKCKIKLEHENITSTPKRFVKTIDRNLIRANGTITVDISYHP
jgi:Ca2+-dependent lipid-binding protein